MLALRPLSTAPLSTLRQSPRAGLPVAPDALAALLAAAEVELTHLVTIASAVPDAPARRMWGMHSARPLSTLASDPRRPPRIETLRLSDCGHVTGADDTPADASYDARVLQPLRWRRSLLGGDGSAGRADFRGGTIRLNTVDGGLSELIEANAIDGQAITVEVGSRGWPRRRFARLFEGTARSWITEREEARIELRGLSWRLDQPIQPVLYAGSGGREGGADLQGKPKPTSFDGAHVNVAPPRLNADEVFQLRDGPIASVEGVYDQARALTRDTSVGNGGDLPGYAALVAASIAPGHHATCLAEGYIRLASRPAGAVTVDFTTSTGAVTPGAVLRAILTGPGGFAERHLNLGSFAALDAAVPHPVEVWVGTEARSMPEVLTRICAGIGGFWGDSRLGRIQVGQLRPPAGGFQRELSDATLLAFRWLPLPAGVGPAVKTARVSYRRNYTEQAVDLDGANVTEARRQLVADRFRWAVASNNDTALFHQEAKVLEVESVFVDAAGAQAHADLLVQSLWTRGRRLAQARVGHAGMLLDLQRKVRVRSERFALDRLFVVVGIDFDAARQEHLLTLLG